MELACVPWARTPEEDDLSWAHFNYWLRLSPRPVPIDIALSTRHAWAERAAAWDSYQQLKGQTPKQSAAEIFESWTLVIRNETKKWLAKSLREQREPCLDPQRIGDFIDLVTDPARNQAGRPSHNLSGLEPEELETLLRLLAKCEANS